MPVAPVTNIRYVSTTERNPIVLTWRATWLSSSKLLSHTFNQYSPREEKRNTVRAVINCLH